MHRSTLKRMVDECECRRSEDSWSCSFFSFRTFLILVWAGFRAFCQPFGHCILSSVCFTLHLFQEDCQTMVEKLHLALEPALSAETCHLDARKRVATQLQIEKCIVFQSLPQLSSTGWGFKANQ